MASKQSASQRAAEARQAAAALRAKQRAASRRNTILASLGALVLVAVFAVLMVFIVKSGENSGPYAVYSNGEMTASSVGDETDGIYITADGIAGGTPPSDAVRVDIYFDPLCPICGVFDEGISAELASLRESDAVALYLHPIAILDRLSDGTQYSTRFVSALWTVAEYAPESFVGFFEEMFDNQPPELEKGLTNDQIADLARRAGVSEEVIAKIAEGEFTEWTEASTDRSSEAGVGGTPTVRIAGVDQSFAIYLYFPGILTYDVLVAADGGTEALAAVAAERDRVYSSAASEEEGNALLGALLEAQAAQLVPTSEPTD